MNVWNNKNSIYGCADNAISNNTDECNDAGNNKYEGNNDNTNINVMMSLLLLMITKVILVIVIMMIIEIARMITTIPLRIMLSDTNT